MKKILVIRFSSIGDVILTTPIFNYIKQKYPDAKIDFLTKEQNKLLVMYHPLINKVFTINTGSFSELLSISKELRENNYDLVLDLHANLRSFILKHSLFSSYKITYEKDILARRLLSGFKINIMDKKVHVVKRYLNTIADNVAELPLPEVYSYLEAENKIAKLIYELRIDSDNILIGFNPGALHFTKRWPVKKFIELGNLLTQQYKVKIFLLGNKQDKLLGLQIAEILKCAAIPIAGALNIIETFALLKHLRLLVTGDTGLMHLANASRTPAIAIFGPTVKEFGFWPYGKRDVIIETKLSCRPCSLHGTETCPIGTHECMESINVEDVFNTCTEIINKS
ncbi:lipopolysaccharide heptosyltransferase II [Candidatus Poribacteria bacterium]|nr:lipopolysaccharide heptosyltransferase II [Candidatus Poribacteria bacterium]